ncbi:unnamed protein product [Acanthoscelides obtectus]|uniref:Uncharacterized protein n=1 Tax=Acanthoscelides obtectus TaxID=200917 RepID=A0A9P0L0U2_ACAOB|nr:unnamed protein product [Acanthoscelides obtectus]CAK1630069.1 hypothetical protein AOBTE_LOCUS6139 [Acanthoscelides obtectus]
MAESNLTLHVLYAKFRSQNIYGALRPFC